MRTRSRPRDPAGRHKEGSETEVKLIDRTNDLTEQMKLIAGILQEEHQYHLQVAAAVRKIKNGVWAFGVAALVLWLLL